MAKFTPKVKQQLILPLHNRGMKGGDSLCVSIVGTIYTGKPQKGDKATEKAADLFRCINLETGELGLFIASAVVKSTLEDTFPDHDYCGRWFMITKGEKKAGQRYYQYSVAELERDAEGEKAAPAIKKTAIAEAMPVVVEAEETDKSE